MKPNVIRGIGRCCTRGFAGAEVVGTVGQWADSGAWDYFVKHGTHTESQKQCSVCQQHVTARQFRGITAKGLSCIRLQLSKWKRQI